MAARVTMVEVQEIIKIDSSITNIDAFINAGNLLVTNTLGNEGLGEDTLKEIERWMVAHFVSSMDPRAIEEEAEGIRVKYSGTFGKNFEATIYGQNALLLDPTGKLAKANSKQASFGVVDYSTANDTGSS